MLPVLAVGVGAGLGAANAVEATIRASSDLTALPPPAIIALRYDVGMRSGTLVSVEEYLNTSYSPDCEYVEGRILERNLGEFDHSRLQINLGSYLRIREKEWGILAV